MSLIGSASFGFAQNTIPDSQNTVLNTWWHCLRQMPQKLKAFNGLNPSKDRSIAHGLFFEDDMSYMTHPPPFWGKGRVEKMTIINTFRPVLINCRYIGY